MCTLHPAVLHCYFESKLAFQASALMISVPCSSQMRGKELAPGGSRRIRAPKQRGSAAGGKYYSMEKEIAQA